jgi:hypothetical protein
VKALKQIVDAYDNSVKAIDEGMFRVLAAAARAALTPALNHYAICEAEPEVPPEIADLTWTAGEMKATHNEQVEIAFRRGQKAAKP